MDGSEPRPAGGPPPDRAPISIPAPLRRLAQRVLMERSDRLLDALTRLAASQEGAGQPDPEAVHDLRVSSRRLREGLATFRPLLPAAPRRHLSALMRDLRDALGEMRNQEIIVAWMDEALPRVSPIQAIVLEGLLEQARADLAAEHAAIGSRLARLGIRHLDHALADLVDAVAPARPPVRDVPEDDVHPSGHQGEVVPPSQECPPGALRSDRMEREAPKSGSVPARVSGEAAETRAFAAAQLKEARLRAHAAERALAGGAPEPLHRLRIRLKRLRYRSECLAALEPRSLAGALVEMRERQELLGRLQDLRVVMLHLGARQDAIAGHIRSRRVGAIARLVARARNQRAAALVVFETRQRRRATSRLAETLEEELRGGD